MLGNLYIIVGGQYINAGRLYIIVGQYRKSPGRAIVQQMISAMFTAPSMESPTNILRTVRIFLNCISSNSVQTKPGIGDTENKIYIVYIDLDILICSDCNASATSFSQRSSFLRHVKDCLKSIDRKIRTRQCAFCGGPGDYGIAEGDFFRDTHYYAEHIAKPACRARTQALRDARSPLLRKLMPPTQASFDKLAECPWLHAAFGADKSCHLRRFEANDDLHLAALAAIRKSRYK